MSETHSTLRRMFTCDLARTVLRVLPDLRVETQAELTPSQRVGYAIFGLGYALAMEEHAPPDERAMGLMFMQGVRCTSPHPYEGKMNELYIRADAAIPRGAENP